MRKPFLLLFLCVLCAFLLIPLSAADGYACPATDSEDVLYSRLEEGLSCFAQQIPLDGLRVTPDTVRTVYSRVLGSEPMLFGADLSYRYTSDADGYVTSVSPNYRMTPKEYEAAADDVREQVTALASLVRGRSELEKALLLHDLICLRFSYDQSLQIADVYRMLTEGSAVCQGYALLYKLLLEEAGMESVCVISPDLLHEWNLVRIDNRWYHVDVTWDDTDAYTLGSISHRYFLLSDAAHDAIPQRQAPRWQQYPCTDTLYDNSPLHDLTSAVFFYDGSFYGIREGQIGAFPVSPDMAGWHTLYDLTRHDWATFGDPFTVWDGTWSGLWVSPEGILFFNTPEKLCYLLLTSPGTAYVDKVYTGRDGLLYGFRPEEDGSLTCSVMRQPNETACTPVPVSPDPQVCTVDYLVQGSCILTQSYAPGQPLVLPGTRPVYPGTRFDGWAGAAEGDPVTGSLRLTARLTESDTYYTVTFRTEEGDLTVPCAEGALPEIPPHDTRLIREEEILYFAGWQTPPAPAEADTVYTARYIAVPRKFLYTAAQILQRLDTVPQQVSPGVYGQLNALSEAVLFVDPSDPQYDRMKAAMEQAVQDYNRTARTENEAFRSVWAFYSPCVPS